MAITRWQVSKDPDGIKAYLYLRKIKAYWTAEARSHDLAQIPVIVRYVADSGWCLVNMIYIDKPRGHTMQLLRGEPVCSAIKAKWKWQYCDYVAYG